LCLDHGLFGRNPCGRKTGFPYIAELQIQHESIFFEWIRVQTVRLENGIAIGASDITARKRAEERFAELVRKYETNAKHRHPPSMN
jgi:hypothetical protein